MIHGDMKTHNYEIDGVRPQIMTEIATLLHMLYSENRFTKDDLYEMVNLATMTEEELKAKASSTLDENPFGTLLNKIFDDAENGNEAAIDLLKILTDMMLDDLRGNKE